MMSFISIIQLPCFANCSTNILFLILQSSIVFNWYIALVSSKMRELVFLFVFFFFFYSIVHCGSDHELLTAKFRLILKKVEKTTRPFRDDVNQIPYDYSGSEK